MLIAAFKSRSTMAPQAQVHDLSARLRSLLTTPQQEHVLELGSKRPIRSKLTPYHSDLYSSISTNIPHPASLIARAKVWFLTMFLTANVSIAIDWFSLINEVETLCRKSLRWLATFSCMAATFFLVRFPLNRDARLCMYLSFNSDLLKWRGLSITCPSEVTRKDLRPRSMPTTSFTGGLRITDSWVSNNSDTKYFPVSVLVTVALLTSPTDGRCEFIRTPERIFGKYSLPPAILKPVLSVYEPERIFFLNLGNLATPSKKRLYASPSACMELPSDWLETSFSQGHSSLSPVICFIRSKVERLAPCALYAYVLVSRARLYTKRQAFICLSMCSAWAAVGYILYLNALSNYQIYDDLDGNLATNCSNLLSPHISRHY